MPDHLLTTPTLLASSALVLWNALEAADYDAEGIFLHAGLDTAKLKDQDARYSARSITRLHEVVIEVTGDPCFMLKLADFWHPSHLHALGYGWLASASLLDAFNRLIRYYDIVSISAERVRLDKVAAGYVFGVDVPANVHDLHETEEDSIMVLLVAMCRISIGAAFTPSRVTMRRSRPECAQEFDDYFGTRVEFASSELTIVLPTDIVETELPTSNRDLARACDHIIDQYLARLDRAHVVNRVRTRLIECMPAGKINEKAIAAALHMSVRSLQRRLIRENTTFKEVLDETRRELAISYIKDKHTSINEITYLLGYSDPANFSRAFKRWTGMPPGAGRASYNS